MTQYEPADRIGNCGLVHQELMQIIADLKNQISFQSQNNPETYFAQSINDGWTEDVVIPTTEDISSTQQSQIRSSQSVITPLNTPRPQSAFSLRIQQKYGQYQKTWQANAWRRQELFTKIKNNSQFVLNQIWIHIRNGFRRIVAAILDFHVRSNDAEKLFTLMSGIFAILGLSVINLLTPVGVGFFIVGCFLEFITWLEYKIRTRHG
jgi:hypothetical protein